MADACALAARDAGPRESITPVHSGRLILPLPPPKPFRIKNFSSLGTRGHQMTDRQREWQKPLSPEVEGGTVGCPPQPWWRADQMSPLPGGGCGS